MGSGGPPPGGWSQFLGNALSRRGPDALPYAEDVKWTVRQQLLDMVTEFPSLKIATGRYTYNDGRQLALLKAEGTAPMFYRGRKYNLPVIVWLPEYFPRSPPICYLNPTADMMIKPHHQNVNSNGMVVHEPYLHQWSFPSSNLLELVHTLCITFGQDPPLFAKPPGWTPSAGAPQPAAHPPPGAAGAHYGQPPPAQPSPYGGYGQSAAYPAPAYGQTPSGAQAHPPVQGGYPQPHYAGGYANPMQGAPPQQYPPQPQQPAQGYPQPHHGQQPPHPAPQYANHHSPPQPVRVKDPKEAFKETALKTLTQRLQATTGALHGVAQERLKAIHDQRAHLRDNSMRIHHAVQQLTRHRDGLENNMSFMSQKIGELEAWLGRNDKQLDYVEPDNTFEPADGLSKQAFKALAADQAIEDCLYALEQALRNGNLDPADYIKKVRILSRKQFYHRALALKVAQLQQAAPPIHRSASGDQGWVHVGR